MLPVIILHVFFSEDSLTPAHPALTEDQLCAKISKQKFMEQHFSINTFKYRHKGQKLHLN